MTELGFGDFHCSQLGIFLVECMLGDASGGLAYVLSQYAQCILGILGGF